jgi:hypothetical protein
VSEDAKKRLEVSFVMYARFDGYISLTYCACRKLSDTCHYHVTCCATCDMQEEERRRRERESQYQLPDAPAIVVHPSTTAKSGKFDCAVVSLSVLLDYRPEDNKEHSFEVGTLCASQMTQIKSCDVIIHYHLLFKYSAACFDISELLYDTGFAVCGAFQRDAHA